MRAIILGLLVAVGVGLAMGSSSVSAAPANGVTINDSATAANAVQNVHWRGRSHRWYRCHYRYQSWGRC
jgi:hypothetical protein